MYLFGAVLLLVFAIILIWLSAQQRRTLGLPEGRVLYADTGTRRELLEPLYADDLNLVGKPDYLVESKLGLVPVEVKSGRTPSKPFDSHIYQLAAYCLLVQRNYRKRPPYGIIRYPGRSFAVDFTRELEEDLLTLLTEMRAGAALRELHRSHEQPGRCISCGFWQFCEERLVV
ncbi:MAG: Dna2/Cas4 domain-containing protein [Chloroflexi bacterium]|nr:Dna2/Cas4 domain-containing protein [Chloroflexota bacterium]